MTNNDEVIRLKALIHGAWREVEVHKVDDCFKGWIDGEARYYKDNMGDIAILTKRNPDSHELDGCAYVWLKVKVN